MFNLLESLIRARYSADKVSLLDRMNAELEVLRCQTRLCHDFQLLDAWGHEHVSGPINAVGENLGRWLRQQRKKDEG